MDKRLNKNIDFSSKSEEFMTYLKDNLSESVFLFMEELAQKSEVLIFSGVIRDFFLKRYKDIRDLDFVLGSFDEKTIDLIESKKFKKNSFGGYKVNIDSLDIDIWELENTWAIKNDKINPKLFKELTLPNSSFFNFSSIIYNFNNKKFITTQKFEKFLESEKLNIVLEQNPLPELCLINTIYYKEKFKLKIDKNLKKYFVTNFEKFNEDDFLRIQKKHFGDIKYTYPFLKTYYEIFSNNLKKNRGI